MFNFMISLIQKFFNLKSANKPKTLQVVDLTNPKSTVILVPVANHIEPTVDEALRELEKRGYTVWRKYGFSAIDQGRCVLAQEALDKGFEHLFWIDADVCFLQYDIDKVIQRSSY